MLTSKLPDIGLIMLQKGTDGVEVGHGQAWLTFTSTALHYSLVLYYSVAASSKKCYCHGGATVLEPCTNPSIAAT